MDIDTAEIADAAEVELARRARAGDRAAFSALYRRFAGAVHGVLLALLPPQDARDGVQEVFLAALGAIDRLDRPERVGPWLCAIARNRARDLLRRKPPTVPLDEEPLAAEVGAAADGADRAADAAEAERVLTALRALPPSYAETLALRLVEGLTGPEIAARTGLTHGSVRVNLCRGMKLLRARLGHGEGDE